ncbi:hypothetical protein GCM10010389_60510 [Streptomyces echinoruber]|uniref:Uncharacterized protein n=1 Tax=Streptomyces echinoruber TaxID=68898 RepID=A0A918RUX0_9ACTN|nr:hypothetical protein GCM10010389_60510 [Streptomyces echinoruber]
MITGQATVPVPQAEPPPIPRCAICRAAATTRERARQIGSPLSVRAASDTIREHPHRRVQ